MSDVPRAVTVPLLLRLLREALLGAPGPWTYFSDQGPGNGILGTIGGVSAAQASRVGGPGQTTIAGHVHHVSASLQVAARELRGDTTSRDRSRNWTVSAVDDVAWAALRTQVQRDYQGLVGAVETRAAWDDDSLGTAIGAIAHAAYHLGAIRQRVAAEG